MNKLKLWKRACGVFLLWGATALALPAQSFITLHRFDGTNTDGPFARLVRATDGNFYGTTAAGGNLSGAPGSVFKVTPNGALTTLHTFNVTDGYGSYAGLVQGTDGNFYGTTYFGGANSCNFDPPGCGTVFKITPSGTLTTLHSFCSQINCADGANPFEGLVQVNGDFYGTTNAGPGTVFKITPSGTLTTLHTFGPTEGSVPNGDLVHASDGNLYGTTEYGGANNPCMKANGQGCGTVFKITPGGVLTTLYSFCSQGGYNCTDGYLPLAGLVQAADGDFYGTTAIGAGVFKITPSGTLTTLYNFCSQANCADGFESRGELIQGTDGNLYGTTLLGGHSTCTQGCGTVFSITTTGTLTTLHSFGGLDGSYPTAGLVQDTDGNFYGVTNAGAAQGRCTDPPGCGTVFGLSVGLAPFVETLPTSGKVGAHIKILGTNLTGATSVTFNGIAATFTVASKHGITTTVPAGATTGTVQVVTPGGTLSSNVPFTVN
jgi:uncharacterized repeat protein (TIGR03803 family)